VEGENIEVSIWFNLAFPYKPFVGMFEGPSHLDGLSWRAGKLEKCGG
jgi:hypothetical protein